MRASADDVGEGVAHRMMAIRTQIGRRIARQDRGHPGIVLGQEAQPAVLQAIEAAIPYMRDRQASRQQPERPLPSSPCRQ